MNAKPGINPKRSPLKEKIKSKIKHWAKRTKALNGEPRYVAMGIAVGIFVSATPTIPFQTIIAVALAFIMRGSKAAAALGVWLSNPITFPVFYLASYKIGAFLFGISTDTYIAGHTASDLLKLGFDISLAAITGGIVIGIILAMGAYIITHKIVRKIRSREKRRQKTRLRLKASPRHAEDPSSPEGFAAERRRQRTENRGQIAPALTTAAIDPACEYSKAILSQPETKDQRPRT
jgi:uncharacterized protein (DUF2062 family)